MSFIFHRSNLTPLIFPNGVFLNRAQSLFAWKTSKHKHSSFTNGNSMRISAFIHRSLIQDLILLGHINPSIFLGRGSTTSNQYFCWTQSNRSWTLIKFMVCIVWQFFKCPFVFIYIITKTNFRVYIITKKINIGLVFRTPIQWWKLKKCLLNWAIIINMNCIFEHIIYKIRRRLNKIIKSL